MIDKPVRCTHEGGAMTPAERKKMQYWRVKMDKAGVSDVRLLPKAKLTDREVGLVNATFEKLKVQPTSLLLSGVTNTPGRCGLRPAPVLFRWLTYDCPCGP